MEKGSTVQSRWDKAEDRGRGLATGRRLKRSVAHGLIRTPVVRLFEPATSGLATVFVLHRFDVEEARHASTSVAELRRTLSYLRRHHYELLPLDHVVRSLSGEAPPVRRAVAFTVDDGYLDQATVGARVFAEFDCPVTIFLMTGFLDGIVVPWWDVIQYVFENTARRNLQLELGGEQVAYAWSSGHGRFQAEMNFLSRCNDAADDVRRAAIEALATAAEVAVPERPVPPNVPMSWEQARSLERSGVTFGAHTVSHPILSSVGPDAARREIGESWRRLQEELDRPIPVFCYPNGRLVDFGHREIDILDAMGMTGAVTVDEAQAELGHGAEDPTARFRVSRLPFPHEHLDAVMVTTGMERVQQRALRSLAGLRGRKALTTS